MKSGGWSHNFISHILSSFEREQIVLIAFKEIFTGTYSASVALEDVQSLTSYRSERSTCLWFQPHGCGYQLRRVFHSLPSGVQRILPHCSCESLASWRGLFRLSVVVGETLNGR
jgi:hypothetical protein